MKNKFLIIFLLLLMMIQPIFATDTYQTKLNGILYHTTYPVLEQDDMLYLSLSDLCSTTLISIYSHTPTSYTLVGTDFNFKLQVYTDSTRYVVGGTEKFLDTPTFISSEQLYVPVSLLSELGYTYTFDLETASLELFSRVPYSRNTEKLDTHTFKTAPENLVNLPTHLSVFTDSSDILSMIEESVANESYLSFASNQLVYSMIPDVLPRFKQSPYDNMFVTMRVIDTTVTPNIITETVTLPLTVDFTTRGTTFYLGEEEFYYPLLWSTFLPVQSLTEQNLTKTAEVTIMKGLYEYYRNTYNFRDDIYFSPLTTLSSDRTNVMTHSVYSVSEADVETHYDLLIYRIHPTGSLQYIVDLIKK